MRSWDAVLDEAALNRIIESASLPIAASTDESAACCGVLEHLAQQACFRAFDGPRLSKRHDLQPLLKAWRSYCEGGSESSRRRLEQLAAKVSVKRFGPIPPAFTHPELFASWLTDMSIMHGVANVVLKQNLPLQVLARARRKAKQVKKSRIRVGAPNLFAAQTGGRYRDWQRDDRTEQLLALFWILFAEQPNASIASETPRARDNSIEATMADGGAAVRFVVAFEAEIASALSGRGDIYRRNVGPSRWEANSEHSASQHLERLLERHKRRWERENRHPWDKAPKRGRDNIWERFALLRNSDGSPAAMLIRREKRNLHVLRNLTGGC